MFTIIIMGITSAILNILNTNTRGSYRHVYSRLSENGTHPRFYKGIDLKEINEQTLRTTLSRLKKQGLLKNENRIWEITKKGVDYIKKISNKNPHFKSVNNSSVKNMIVIFDIPELHRKKRNWLRIELAGLGFTLLQKSVWFGPSPLPKDFLDYLHKNNLLEYLKFFKAEEKNII